MTTSFAASLARRTAILMAGWIVLGRTGPVDLVVGGVVALLCAYVTQFLCPPARPPVSVTGALRFAIRFVARSLAAGADVASRVLARIVRVRPGVRVVHCDVPAGVMRQSFSSLSSLQPGILPLGGGDTFIRVHSLDVEGPVEADMAADAEAFLAMYHAGAR